MRGIHLFANNYTMKKRKPRAGRGFVAEKSTASLRQRESSDNPILKAFMRVAPSVRFSDRAIFLAGVFLRAPVFNSRRSAVVQARRFDAFFGMHISELLKSATL